jgi:peptidoglycan biosynthesis protein MviN/MurJ (putative lipid II flippase)
MSRRFPKAWPIVLYFSLPLLAFAVDGCFGFPAVASVFADVIAIMLDEPRRPLMVVAVVIQIASLLTLLVLIVVVWRRNTKRRKSLPQ